MGKREHPPAYATLRDGILLGGTAKIMADINVVVSGAFFGGYQRKVIDAVAGAPISAAATEEIVREYMRSPTDFRKRDSATMIQA